MVLHSTVTLLLFLSLFLAPRSPSPSISSPLPNADDLPTSDDKLSEIYAPFDSIRTDLEDYAWPTEASTVLTSGFAEFRNTHFHAGIDISTWNRTGYKVFAARDGYIARIRISPYGYGKMLYVRHADGYYTTYAHLQRFNDSIDEYARVWQYKNGRYTLDLELPPNEIPVRKGDVIAYSGDTGIGSPHLHFEIRDERLNPVNPFLVPLFAELVEDTTPPEFQEIVFTPLHYSAIVQGDHRPWIARVKRQARQTTVGLARQTAVGQARNQYQLEDVAHLTGPIGIGVKAFDRANHSYHRNSIRTFELYVDSLLLYTARLDRFPADESKQIALYYDWGLLQRGKGRFQKLYIEPGNRLPVYDRLPEGSGILQPSLFAEGMHTLRIIATDGRGHSSELRGTIVLNHPPAFDLTTVDKTLYLKPASTSTIEAIRLSWQHGKSWVTQRLPLTALTSTEHGYLLPTKSATPAILRIEAENRFGTTSAPHFVVPGTARRNRVSLTIKEEFYRDYVYLTITAPSAFLQKPRVMVGSQQQPLSALAKDPRTYIATVPLQAVNNNVLLISIEGETAGGIAEERLEIPIYPITPERGGTISVNDELTVYFPPDAVYQPVFIRVARTNNGYTLLPSDIVLNKGATAEYYLTDASRERLGVFIAEGSGWRLAAHDPTGISRTLTGRFTRQLGGVALFHDYSAPSISRFTSSYRRGRLSFSFRLSDTGSGIDYDRTRLTINGELLIAEYDPYRHHVKFDERRDLPAGTYHLVIEAFDRMGNRSLSKHRVSVPSR
ncbi:MAG TPA: peptidoglycan DD-metalloendopeptidase family protein [Bacteroidota bacterium]|nr:peptidoglycan DD-metalloendopeptidase family protein [Bacteroidota bacterium]